MLLEFHLPLFPEINQMPFVGVNGDQSLSRASRARLAI